MWLFLKDFCPNVTNIPSLHLELENVASGESSVLVKNTNSEAFHTFPEHP
jgi:hypothetical protein